MSRLATDIAAGVLSGLLYAAPHAFAAPHMLLVASWYLAPLPLLYRGLTRGAVSVMFGGPAGLLAAAMAAGPLAALGFLFIHGLPSFWIAFRTSSGMDTPGEGGVKAARIVTELAVYASLVYLAALAGHGFRLDGLTDGIREAVKAALGAGGGRPTPQAEDLAAAVARFFPGIFGAWWVVMMMGNATLAQLIAAAAGRARRQTPAWSAFRTPEYLPVLLVAATLPAAVLGEPSGLAFAGLAMILGVPLLCQGLAVIHATSRGLRLRRLALGACYASMLVWPVAPLAFALLAALGTVDHAGRFREARGAT